MADQDQNYVRCACHGIPMFRQHDPMGIAGYCPLQVLERQDHGPYVEASLTDETCAEHGTPLVAASICGVRQTFCPICRLDEAGRRQRASAARGRAASAPI